MTSLGTSRTIQDDGGTIQEESARLGETKNSQALDRFLLVTPLAAYPYGLRQHPDALQIPAC